ncbi:MAG: hypothetical protein H6734_27660 [Alphaproteobacteria bacterium]|nr:hypothetical protein [Alphaproteobacteria bacterium]MCB9688116.1 hypothetical protein [Alphaproteobacteria bacterium]
MFVLLALAPDALAADVCHANGNGNVQLVTNAGPGHAGHSNDFPWSVAYDADCQPIDIWSSCVDTSPLTGVEPIFGGSTSTDHTCLAPHSDELLLDPGESRIVCQQGSATNPYYHVYHRYSTSEPYGTWCVAGQEREVGPWGGELEVDCGTGATVQFARLNLLGQITLSPAVSCSGLVPLDFTYPRLPGLLYTANSVTVVATDNGYAAPVSGPIANFGTYTLNGNTFYDLTQPPQ